MSTSREIRTDPCSFDGCPDSLYDIRRGLCKRHYRSLWTRGELPPALTVYEAMSSDRWRRVTENGCWEWRGTISSQGYGRWGSQYVHRLSAQAALGALPVGTEIDHLCRNRRCFNPEHLEPVTHDENMKRSAQAHILRTGRCAAGHVMDEENTRLYRTKAGHLRRICAACHRRRQANRRPA